MNNISENNNLNIDYKILVEEQPKLSAILKSFHNLDKVCYRLGLLNKNASLASEISWAALDEKNDLQKTLKKLDSTRDQIEQQILQLKTMMTSRCLYVIGWELLLFIILSVSLLLGSYFSGYWINGNFSPPWLNELFSRPILVTSSSLLVIISFVIVHYSLRRFFAVKIAKKATKAVGKFTLVKAFLMNSKFIHSIFRPEPVGLHWINRKRLQKAHDLYLLHSEEKK